MKIIIDIPEEVRIAISQMGLLRISNEMQKKVDKAIQHGTPLPKGHGVDVLDKIRTEIEGNMESIIGKYDSSISKFNMPSYKIERNKAREECISIIDKYKAESEE